MARVFMVLGALWLIGCVSMGNNSLRNDSALQQIVVGKSVRSDVHQILGEPRERRSIPLGPVTDKVSYEWWGYSYSRSVINPLDYLLLVGFFVNGIGLPDMQRDVQIFFEPDGTVRSVRDQTTHYDLGVIRENRVASSIKTETLLTPLRRDRAIRYEERVDLATR